MNETKHTPTPWISQGLADSDQADEVGSVTIVGDNLGGLVAVALPWPTERDAAEFSRVEANAAFIVRAANAHDALVDALAGLMRRLDDHFGGDPRNDWKEQEQARAALASKE